MLRVAGSLKRGGVTASLLISRLQAYRRQNALIGALKEYGRLVKTIFILRFLESEQLRRRINTQLNKGGYCQLLCTGEFQAAGFCLTPSTKTVPLTTSDRSVEPFNARHFFDADSISL